ncbi:hypothetical protein H0H93_011111 [Arthromyces matolae]|nr:hypothetical protein H0H93_011111 [Arthromyces matolae]
MPSNLQGLNIVHPIHQTPDTHDLLSGQYSDINAQLDLWTNLPFEDDGPLGNKSHETYLRKNRSVEEEEEEAALTSHGSPSSEAAIHDGHVNVITAREHHHAQQPPFDINALFSTFGVEPFSIPHAQAPSLAQLIALHNAPPHVPSFPLSSPPNSELDLRATPPPAKRTRTRKSSVTTTTTSVAAPTTPMTAPSSPEEPVSGQGPAIAAAEDKRRRNTAASARFRLKKKEREAALEARAKELEARVNELERECEGLRRENGWLKGLVVGVTGAAQAPPAPVPTGTKRTRDD